MSSLTRHSFCWLFAAEIDPKEHLAQQRKLLQRKLGLDMGAAIGMDTEELFNDEDLDYACPTGGVGSHGSKPTAGSSSRNHSVSLTQALCRSRCSITNFYLLKEFCVALDGPQRFGGGEESETLCTSVVKQTGTF